ncbi:hypothetical protein, partial [Mesorhizobium japonicum]|uniref:hypothetical protein n=1 Tax=Mesorhizobium japonicum TaxID=2066070 RepID=UPI003B5C1D20
MIDTLADYSLVLAYSAIAVYALAFVAYVLDLSRRTGANAVPSVASSAAGAGAASQSVTASRGGTALLERVGTVTSRIAAGQAKSVNRATRFQRTGFALTIVAWVVHVGSIVLRG